MAANLAALLKREKELWQEFHQLTLKQGEVLTPERGEKLAEILDRKDRCIAELTELEQKINMLAQCEKETNQLTELRKDITALMEKIREIDADNRRIIAANFNEYKKEIDSFQAGKEAALAYKEVLKTGKGFFVDANR